jgi:hypothetical protein
VTRAFAVDLAAERTARRHTPSNTYALLTFDELLRLPPPAWLIDGLVPAHGLSVLYGAPATGKSFLAIDWALSVATGSPWLGQDVQPRWVVYIAGEGKAGLAARARAWWLAHDRPDLGRIRWLPEAVNLRDPAQIERARQTLAILPEVPGLVVVDTVARSLAGGDENSARDVGEFIAAIDGLRRDGAALAVHHSGHNGDRERGSSALRGAADLLARIERDGRSSRVTLKCDKLKEAAEWEPIPVAMEPAHGSLVLSRIVEREHARDDLQDRVEAFVAQHQPVSKRKVREGVSGRAADVDAALEALERNRRLSRSKQGWTTGPPPEALGPCPDGPDTPGHTPSRGQGEAPCPPGGKTPKGSPDGTRSEPVSGAACPGGVSEPPAAGPHGEEMVA